MQILENLNFVILMIKSLMKITITKIITGLNYWLMSYKSLYK